MSNRFHIHIFMGLNNTTTCLLHILCKGSRFGGFHWGENSVASCRPTATFWVSGAPLTPSASQLTHHIIIYYPYKHILGVHCLCSCPWSPQSASRFSTRIGIRPQRPCDGMRALLIMVTLLMYYMCHIDSAPMLRMTLIAWEYPKPDTHPTLP